MDKKEIKQRRKRCPVCKKLKSVKEVYKRLCGYELDINRKEVIELICNDCEQEHCNEI